MNEELGKRWQRIDWLQSKFGFSTEEAQFVVNHWSQLEQAINNPPAERGERGRFKKKASES